jgi:hypothetical protein
MPVLGMALLVLLGFAVIGILLAIAMFAETRRNNQQKQPPNSSAEACLAECAVSAGEDKKTLRLRGASVRPRDPA